MSKSEASGLSEEELELFRECHLADELDGAERLAVLARIQSRAWEVLQEETREASPEPSGPSALRRFLVWGVWGTAAALGAVVVGWPRSPQDDARGAASQAAEDGSPQLSSDREELAVALRPCVKGKGDAPWFSRFEEAGQYIPPRISGPPRRNASLDIPTLPIDEVDGRLGYWFHTRNTRGEDGRLEPLFVQRHLAATTGDAFALRVAGPAPVGWGANAGIRFSNCYDASAYAGVRFRVKGSGVLFVSLQTLDTIPVEMGGLCRRQCWLAPKRAVALMDQFQAHELHWAQLSGEQPSAVVAKELLQVMFSVESGSEPYEFWLDDVGLLGSD